MKLLYKRRLHNTFRGQQTPEHRHPAPRATAVPAAGGTVLPAPMLYAVRALYIIKPRTSTCSALELEAPPHIKKLRFADCSRKSG